MQSSKNSCNRADSAFNGLAKILAIGCTRSSGPNLTCPLTGRAQTIAEGPIWSMSRSEASAGSTLSLGPLVGHYPPHRAQLCDTRKAEMDALKADRPQPAAQVDRGVGFGGSRQGKIDAQTRLQLATQRVALLNAVPNRYWLTLESRKREGTEEARKHPEKCSSRLEGCQIECQRIRPSRTRSCSRSARHARSRPSTSSQYPNRRSSARKLSMVSAWQAADIRASQ